MVAQKNLQLKIEVALDAAAAKKGLQALGGELRSLDVPVRLDTASLGAVRVPVVVDKSGLESLRVPLIVDASGSKAIGQSIAEEVGNALKDLKLPGQGGFFSGLINTITAPIQSVFRGAFEGIGRDISSDFGKGVSQGVGRELAPIIGSFELLGREGAGALVKAHRKALAPEARSLQGVVRGLVGEERFYTEVGSAQAKERRRSGGATIAATREFQQQRASFDKEGYEVQLAKLDQQAAEAQSLEERLNREIVEEAQKRSEKTLKRIQAVYKQIQALPVDAPSGQLEAYSRQIESLKGVLEQIEAGVLDRFKARLDRLEGIKDSIDSQRFELELKKQPVTAGAYLGRIEPIPAIPAGVVDLEKSIYGQRSRQRRLNAAYKKDAASVRQARELRTEEFVKPEVDQSKLDRLDQVIAELDTRQAKRRIVYRQLAENIAVEESRLRSLLAQAEQPRVAQATHSAVLKGLEELQIKNKKLTNILQSVLDLGDESLARTVLTKLKLRGFEVAQLERLSRRTNAARDIQSPSGGVTIAGQPPVAPQSKPKEDVATKLYKELARQVAQLSGVKIDDTMIPKLRIVDELPHGAVASYRGGGLNAVTIPKEVAAELESGEVSKRTVEILAHELRHAVQHEFGKISPEAVDVSGLIKPTQRELDANHGQIPFLVSSSTEAASKMVGGTSVNTKALEEDAYTFTHRYLDRLYEALAQSMQDAVADSQHHPDAEVEQQARTSQAEARQPKSKASSATQQQQKREADSPPEKGGIVLSQSTALGAAQKPREAVGFLVKAVRSAAQSAIGLAQDMEEVVLAIIPFGKAVKIATQKFAIPATIFTAASHALPGGQTIAGVLEHLLSAALDPATGAIAANATEIVTKLIYETFAHVPFGDKIVHALLENIIPVINATKSAALEGLAASGVAVAGGRAIQGAGQAALNAAEEQAKAFPDRVRRRLPSAEGDRQPFSPPVGIRRGEEGLEIEVNTTRLTQQAGELMKQAAEVAGSAGEAVKKGANKVRQIVEEHTDINVGEVLEQAIELKNQVTKVAQGAGEALDEVAQKVGRAADDLVGGTRTIDVSAVQIDDPWEVLPAAIVKGSEQVIDVAAQEIKEQLSESQAEVLAKARQELKKILAGSEELQKSFAQAIADGDRRMVEIKGKAIQGYESQTKEQIGKLKQQLADVGLDVRPGTDLQREFDLQAKGKVTREAKKARKEFNKFQESQSEPELYAFAPDRSEAGQRSLDAAGGVLADLSERDREDLEDRHKAIQKSIEQTEQLAEIRKDKSDSEEQQRYRTKIQKLRAEQLEIEVKLGKASLEQSVKLEAESAGIEKPFPVAPPIPSEHSPGGEALNAAGKVLSQYPATAHFAPQAEIRAVVEAEIKKLESSIAQTQALIDRTKDTASSADRQYRQEKLEKLQRDRQKYEAALERDHIPPLSLFGAEPVESKIYDLVATEVAKLSGVPGVTPPQLVHSPNLKKGALGGYYPSENVIAISDGLAESLKLGQIGSELVDVLAHELRHAFQFGLATDPLASSIPPDLRLSLDDLKHLSPKDLAYQQRLVEASSKGKQDIDSARAIESDAYAFGELYKERIRQAVLDAIGKLVTDPAALPPLPASQALVAKDLQGRTDAKVVPGLRAEVDRLLQRLAGVHDLQSKAYESKNPGLIKEADALFEEVADALRVAKARLISAEQDAILSRPRQDRSDLGDLKKEAELYRRALEESQGLIYEAYRNGNENLAEKTKAFVAEVSTRLKAAEAELTAGTGEVFYSVSLTKDDSALNSAGELLSASTRLAEKSLVELSDRLERFALIVRTTAVEVYRSEKAWEALDNLIVNLGGTLASAVAGHAGIVPGLAGDLNGALATRGAVAVGREAQAAYQDLMQQEAFQTVSALEKLQLVVSATAIRLQSPEFQQKIGRQLTEDLIGFVVGNGAAHAIGAAAPVLAPVPLKGAAVAAPIVPKLADVRDNHARTAEASTTPADEAELYAFDPRQILDRAGEALQSHLRTISDYLNELAFEIRELSVRPSSEQLQQLGQLEAEAGVQVERDQARIQKSLELLEAEIEVTKTRVSVINATLEQVGVTAEEQLADAFDDLGRETRVLIDQVEQQQRQSSKNRLTEEEFGRLRQEQIEALRRNRYKQEAGDAPLSGVTQAPAKSQALRPLPSETPLEQIDRQIDRGSVFLQGEKRDRFERLDLEAQIPPSKDGLSADQYELVSKLEQKVERVQRQLDRQEKQQEDRRRPQGRREQFVSDVQEKTQKLIGAAGRIFRDQAPSYTEAAKKGFNGLKNAVSGAVPPMNRMGDALAPVNRGMKFLIAHAKEAVIGFIAFQVLGQAADQIIRFGVEAFKTSSRIDALQKSLAFSAGSDRAAAEQIAFVRAESERLKIPVDSATEGYRQLANAVKGTAYEGRAIQQVFAGLTQAARVNGLTNEKLQQIYVGAGQIFTKGAVQTEELRGQILETGVATFKQFADAMGITTGELNKRLDQGRVGVDDFIKFTQKIATDSAAGVAAATQAPQAAMDGLANEFTKFQEQFGKSITPAAVAGMQLLGAALQGVSGFLQSVGRDADVVYQALKNLGIASVATSLLGGLGAALKAVAIDSGAATLAFKGLIGVIAVLGGKALIGAAIAGFYGLYSAALLAAPAILAVAPAIAASSAVIAIATFRLEENTRSAENWRAGMSEARRAALEAGETFDVKFNDAIAKLQKGTPLAADELQYLKDGLKANVAAGLDSAHAAEVLSGRLDKLQGEAQTSAAAISKLNKEVIESELAFKKSSVAIEQAMLDRQAAIAEARASGQISGDAAREQELQAEVQHSQDLARLSADRKDTLSRELAQKTQQRINAQNNGQETAQLVQDEKSLQDQLIEISKQAAQSRTQVVQAQTAAAQEVVTRAETQRSIATQALLNQGVITEEQANLVRLKSTRARIFQQIQIEGDSAQKRLELYQNDREQQQANNAIRLQQYEDVFSQEQAIIQEALNKRQITEQQAAYLSIEQEGRKLDAQLKFENQTEAERNKLKLERIKNAEQQRQALKAIEIRGIEDAVTQEQILIQEALNNRQIAQEQANTELLNLEHERLKAQLALEQNTAEERAKLTLELLKNEQQLQEDLHQSTVKRLDEQVRAIENSAQKRKAALEVANSTLEQQNRLIEAQKGLYDAINGVRENEYDIAIKLAKNNEERAKLEQAAANYRIAALREAQKLEREIFELKLLQEKSQRNISRIQNEAELAKAQAERQKLDTDPTATPEQKRAADLTIEALNQTRDSLALIDSESSKIASLQRQGLLSQQFVADRNARLNAAEKIIDPGQRDRALKQLGEESRQGLATPIRATGVEAAQQTPRSTLGNPGNVIQLTPGILQSLIQNAPRISLASQPPQAPQRQTTQIDPAAVVSDFVQRIQVQQRPIMIELTQNFSPDERGQVADRARTEVLDVLDEVTRKW